MRRVIPAAAHRAALKLAHALRRRWWRLRRPFLLGCRILALDENGRILLIRQSYGSSSWLPPGGGVGRDEDAVAAASRELREETGCTLCEACEVATVQEILHGARNEVHVVVGKAEGDARADAREVIEARFFPLHSLPADLSSNLREAIPGWVALYQDHSRDS